MKKIPILFLLLFLTFLKAYTQVVINEICPANADVIYDPVYYNFSGWVELYNKNATSISVGGYYLSDDAAQKNKWKIPNGTSIPANGRLIIWCDDHNAGLHTNFSLDSDGEELILSNASLTELDRINFPKQYTNIAYGRKTDAAAEWAYLTTPTPGTANNNLTATTRLENPSFSLLSGRYSGTQSLTMSHAGTGADIRYTTDGSEPNASSQKYTQPLAITNTTTVKAIAFQSGFLPSKAEVKTYFINEHPFTLPVVSISTSEQYLWDNTIGIYTNGTNGITGNCQDIPMNWNQDWDRHAVFEYFQPTGVKIFDQPVDIRIGGACSRNNPQKSIVIKARDKYGKNHFEETMFTGKNTDRFGGFILRNSGNDFWNTMFRDALMQTLSVGQMDVDYMAYQPTIFYLNGDYWGIQNLREKIDADYIESNYGIPKNDLDLLEMGGNALEGTPNAYFQYMDSLQKINLADPKSFSFIDRHIDVQEYINYVTAEIYYCNTDWPGNNVKFWRQRSTNGKFRWILWDLDFGFGLYEGWSYATHPTLAFATYPDNTGWPNPSWSTLHLRLLLQNPVFKARLIQTLTSSLHTTFEPDRVISMINIFRDRIAAEIPYHTARWGMSVDNWNYEVQRLHDFATQRNVYMQGHIRDFFGMDEDVSMSIKTTPAAQGSYALNGIVSDKPMVSAPYYKNLGYQVTAVPANGYKFKNWKITKRETTFVPLVTSGSAWKYFDQGTLPSATWKELIYDDNAWASGSGQFGYGDGDEQTVVSYGPDANNKFITTYFRKTFTTSDTTGLTSLTGNILYDDGVAVYLNGVEIYRDNLPGGEITNSTLAVQAIPTENNFVSFIIPKGMIMPGENILAIEIHQNSPTSSDISFDLKLSTNKVGAEVSVTTTNITVSDTATSDVSLEAFFELATPIQGLVINEVFASGTSISDDFAETEDWIELYNGGNVAVDLAGLFITDDLSNPAKHLLAADKKGKTLLAPGAYKILWADEDLWQGALHLNFKLSGEGEEVGLYQLIGNSMTKLNDVVFPLHQDNVSFSRIPNATGPFEFTTNLTPLQNNDFVTSVDEHQAKHIQLYPNPTSGAIHIASELKIARMALYDNRGTLIFDTTEAIHELPVQNLQAGLYILILQSEGETITKRFLKK